MVLKVLGCGKRVEWNMVRTSGQQHLIVKEKQTKYPGRIKLPTIKAEDYK